MSQLIASMTNIFGGDLFAAGRMRFCCNRVELSEMLLRAVLDADSEGAVLCFLRSLLSDNLKASRGFPCNAKTLPYIIQSPAMPIAQNTTVWTYTLTPV